LGIKLGLDIFFKVQTKRVFSKAKFCTENEYMTFKMVLDDVLGKPFAKNQNGRQNGGFLLIIKKSLSNHN